MKNADVRSDDEHLLAGSLETWSFDNLPLRPPLRQTVGENLEDGLLAPQNPPSRFSLTETRLFPTV